MEQQLNYSVLSKLWENILEEYIEKSQKMISAETEQELIYSDLFDDKNRMKEIVSKYSHYEDWETMKDALLSHMFAELYCLSKCWTRMGLELGYEFLEELESDTMKAHDIIDAFCYVEEDDMIDMIGLYLDYLDYPLIRKVSPLFLTQSDYAEMGQFYPFSASYPRKEQIRVHDTECFLAIPWLLEYQPQPIDKDEIYESEPDEQDDPQLLEEKTNTYYLTIYQNFDFILDAINGDNSLMIKRNCYRYLFSLMYEQGILQNIPDHVMEELEIIKEEGIEPQEYISQNSKFACSFFYHLSDTIIKNWHDYEKDGFITRLLGLEAGLYSFHQQYNPYFIEELKAMKWEKKTIPSRIYFCQLRHQLSSLRNEIKRTTSSEESYVSKMQEELKEEYDAIILFLTDFYLFNFANTDSNMIQYVKFVKENTNNHQVLVDQFLEDKSFAKIILDTPEMSEQQRMGRIKLISSKEHETMMDLNPFYQAVKSEWMTARLNHEIGLTKPVIEQEMHIIPAILAYPEPYQRVMLGNAYLMLCYQEKVDYNNILIFQYLSKNLEQIPNFFVNNHEFSILVQKKAEDWRTLPCEMKIDLLEIMRKKEIFSESLVRKINPFYLVAQMEWKEKTTPYQKQIGIIKIHQKTNN